MFLLKIFWGRDLKDCVSELLLCIMQDLVLMRYVNGYVTLLNCMVLVKYAVRTGLFRECNVAGKITS